MTARDLTVAFCGFLAGAFAGLVLMSFVKTSPLPVEAAPEPGPTPDNITITFSSPGEAPVEPIEPSAVEPVSPVYTVPSATASPTPVPPIEVVEAVAEVEDPAESAPESVSPSHTIVFEANGAELGQVLRHLARAARVNIVVSDLVTGTVTIRMTDITPLKGIEIIASSKGLLYDKIDGIYYIKTFAELATEPTEPRSFSFINAKAAEAMEIAKKAAPLAGDPVLDARTNTILYRARISESNDIEHFLKWLDRPYPPDPSKPEQSPFLDK